MHTHTYTHRRTPQSHAVLSLFSHCLLLISNLTNYHIYTESLSASCLVKQQNEQEEVFSLSYSFPDRELIRQKSVSPAFGSCFWDERNSCLSWHTLLLHLLSLFTLSVCVWENMNSMHQLVLDFAFMFTLTLFQPESLAPYFLLSSPNFSPVLSATTLPFTPVVCSRQLPLSSSSFLRAFHFHTRTLAFHAFHTVCTSQTLCVLVQEIEHQVP